MSKEAEMPGKEVSQDQLRVIFGRYYFASKFVSGKKVLEVGCGTGIGLGYLAKKAKKIVGIDISADNLNIAKAHYKNTRRIELFRLNAHNLSFFKPKSFDVIIAMATVYALNLEEFLKECQRILKKSGKLIFCLPNKDQPGFQPAKLSTKYYSVPELFTVLNKYKFNPKIFAAFPITKSLLRQRGISNFLNSMIGGSIIRKFLNKVFLHKISLEPEITEKDMNLVKDIKFVPLKPNLTNSQYRILYVIAQKKI